MNPPNIPGIVEIECTVSVGPGVQCSASRNGFITIQTKTESITILLQRIINKKRVTVKPVDQQPVQIVASSSGSSASQAKFWFAGNNDPDDTPQDEVDDRPDNLLSSDYEEIPECTVQVARKAGNEAENVFRGKNHVGLDEHGDRGDDIDAINSDGSNNKRSMQKKPKKPTSDEELTKICQTLALKTLKKWKVKQRKEKKSLEALLSNWPTFFGHTSYASLGQWSYQALDTSEKFGGLQRPFHKMGLADWWNGCLKRRTSENTITRVKARMVSALEPSFEKLDSKEKEAKRKQIDRYVLQGEIISLMFTRAPGLVITVSDLITTSEYHDLWSNRDRSLVLGFNWIDEELIQESELYSESVQSIFSLMHQHFMFIQQPTLDQNASCTLLRSPIEPESETSVASSCRRVTPSSKEFVPSYQNSLCGQQSFVDSIEASTNATKRRKISRHATSQAQAGLCTIQEDDENTSAPILEAPLTNIHTKNQAHDVAIAANVLRSLQHGNQGYTGVAAADLPLGDQLQPSPPASGILEQCSVAEYGGGSLGEASNASTEDHQVSCDGSAGSVTRSCHLSTSDLGRSEPDQQYFSGHLGVLLDGQADGLNSDGLALVNRISGIDELESQQLPVADGLFLSNFMQEYREIM